MSQETAQPQGESKEAPGIALPATAVHMEVVPPAEPAASAPPTGAAPVIPPAPQRELNPRQERFCQLVAAGSTLSDAWRKVYKNPKASWKRAGDGAHGIMQSPNVQRRIRELRGLGEAKAILSLDDRRAILAGIAQRPDAKDRDRIQALDVYNKMSPDRPPEPMAPPVNVNVNLAGDPAHPIHISAKVNLSRADRVSAIIAARRERMAREKAAGIIPAAAADTTAPLAPAIPQVQ